MKGNVGVLGKRFGDRWEVYIGDGDCSSRVLDKRTNWIFAAVCHHCAAVVSSVNICFYCSPFFMDICSDSDVDVADDGDV